MCEERRSLGVLTPAPAIPEGVPTALDSKKIGFSCVESITKSLVLHGALHDRLLNLVTTAEKLPRMIYTGGFEVDLVRAASFRESL